MSARSRVALVAAGLSLAACGGSGLSAESPSSRGEEGLDVTRIGSEPPQHAEDLPEPDDPSARPSRAEITPNAFRIADLPVAVIPAPLDPAAAPESVAAGGGPEENDEISIQRRDDGSAEVSLRLADRGLGRIRIGDVESGTLEGLRVKCAVARRTAVPMRWETLHRDADGLGRYTVVNAWFDAGACRHSVVERASVAVAPVLGRLLHAFRECRWVCADGQRVTLLGPALHDVAWMGIGAEAHATGGAFGRVTFELQAGTGSSLTARIGSRALERWYGPRRPAWAADDVAVGVDITQSVREREPVAVAYLATPKPPVPRARD